PFVFEKFYKNEKILKVKHQFCLTAQDFVLIWFIQLSNVGLQPPYQGVKKRLDNCIKPMLSIWSR
ncbi:MAG: hypothetical protein MRZ09_06050, partial [Coprobacillus sp.]|nr:hypothetical protein [Coprobacillus sp.]